MFYPTVTQDIFNMYVCEDIHYDADTPVSYLEADYRILCATNTHTVFQYIGYPLTVLYGLGIPLMAFCAVFPHRQAIADEMDGDIQITYGFVYFPYRAAVYWWEGVLMLRTLGFAAIVTLVTDSFNQIFFAAALTLFYMGLHSHVAPYKNDIHNNLEMMGLSSVSFVLYGSLFYKVHPDYSWVVYCLMGANFLCLCYCGMHIVQQYWADFKETAFGEDGHFTCKGLWQYFMEKVLTTADNWIKMAKHVFAEVRAEIKGEELQLTPEQMEERALENAKRSKRHRSTRHASVRNTNMRRCSKKALDRVWTVRRR